MRARSQEEEPRCGGAAAEKRGRRLRRGSRSRSQEVIAMNDRPLLICYDGSEGAGRAIDVAGTLFHGHSAVVLDIVGLTPEESLAAVSPVVPDFEELNIPEGGSRRRASGRLRRAHLGRRRTRCRRVGRRADRARVARVERRAGVFEGERLARGRGARWPAGADRTARKARLGGLRLRSRPDAA